VRADPEGHVILVSIEQLAAATGAQRVRAASVFEGLNEALQQFGFDTQPRIGMLLANVGHETMQLRYLSELWGPTKQQKRYERDFGAPWPASREQARDPRFATNRLAWTLGNHTAGDGKRFAGHGLLQNTGRTNHALARDRLRAALPGIEVPDFEDAPSQLATPRWGWMAAAEYAARVGCLKAADEGRFDNFCDLINLGRETDPEGDSNGYDHRLALWDEFNDRGGLAAS
jgi:putative chitinase